VLGDLEVEVLLLAGVLDLGGEQVVLVGHRVGGELHVDDRADDARDAPDAARRVSVFSAVIVAVMICPLLTCSRPRALAPPTISLISWVISAWRAWLASRVYFLMSSSALSVADFIARWRAASSEAATGAAVEDAAGDVLRQQRVEHLLGAGLEGVERQHVVLVRPPRPRRPRAAAGG
jgi:hypothetical protein